MRVVAWVKPTPFSSDKYVPSSTAIFLAQHRRSAAIGLRVKVMVLNEQQALLRASRRGSQGHIRQNRSVRAERFVISSLCRVSISWLVASC